MTELRLLLPGPAVVGDLQRARSDALQALADLYAYPEPIPPRGWVRACMISTIDGQLADVDTHAAPTLRDDRSEGWPWPTTEAQLFCSAFGLRRGPTISVPA